MKSIIKHLGTDQFKRIRIGVGDQRMVCQYLIMYYRNFQKKR